MNALWSVLLAAAVALGVAAGTVFALGDRSVLVSPPEAVVEDFVRALATDRYDRAVPYLSKEIGSRVGTDSLRALTQALESRIGDIEDVRCERFWMTRDNAAAFAVLTATGADLVSFELPLTWTGPEWAIAGLHGLVR